MIPKLTHVKRTIRNKNIPKQISINFEWFCFLIIEVCIYQYIIILRGIKKKKWVKEKNKNFNNFINDKQFLYK